MLEKGATSSARMVLSIDHSSANSGNREAKSFTPGTIVLLAQTGQLVPLERLFTVPCHSCPSAHRHHTRSATERPTVEGEVLFRVACHSRARSGRSVAKSLNPGAIRLPEQVGHPSPRPVRFLMGASHECPIAHCHHADLDEPGVKSSGRFSFRPKSQCKAMPGLTAARF